MNLSKITSEITAGITKSAKVAKKAIQAASQEIQQEMKLQKDLDSAAVLGKSIVKKTKKITSKEAQKVMQDIEGTLDTVKKNSSGKFAKAMEDFQAQSKKVSGESIESAIRKENKVLAKECFAPLDSTSTKVTDAYATAITPWVNILSEKDQVRQITADIMAKYPDLTPEEATKSAMELVKSIGLQSGKSAKEAAKVMGNKKNALEIKLDNKDLKRKLLEKQNAKQQQAIEEEFQAKIAKAQAESEFKKTHAGKLQEAGKILDRQYGSDTPKIVTKDVLEWAQQFNK